MTRAQKSYISDLICRQKDFREDYPYDDIWSEGADGTRFMRRGGRVFKPLEEAQCEWINKTWGDNMEHLIVSLEELDASTASTLINELREREI